MKQFTDLEKLAMFDSIYEKWNCETKSAIEYMKERDSWKNAFKCKKESLHLVNNDLTEVIKRLNQYEQYTETPLAQEYKEKLEDIKNEIYNFFIENLISESELDDQELKMLADKRWLINRVEQGVYYHAHAEYQISILNKVKEFANNKYLKDVKSTTDFRGGYAAALEDLKQLLGNK